MNPKTMKIAVILCCGQGTIACEVIQVESKLGIPESAYIGPCFKFMFVGEGTLTVLCSYCLLRFAVAIEFSTVPTVFK